MRRLRADEAQIVHDRMPVLLTGEESRDPKIIEREPLEDMMRPLGDGALAFYRAGGGSGIQ